MIAATTFNNKKVAVFGLGRTGLAVIEALQKGGAEVWAFDDNADACEKARADGLPIIDLHEADWSELDSYVLSPGVPLTHPKPHWSVDKAKAAGVEIIGDTEVFVRQVAGTGAKIVAITGTNGKSTTTALIGHVLTSGGIDAEIGGNIGTAVFLLSPPSKGKTYVLEFSSYQLDLTPSLKPDVAVLMNLSPDHLDRHGNMENYAAVKAKIFARQVGDDVSVVSVDDDYCAQIASQLTDRKIVEISVEQTLEHGVRAHGVRAGGVMAPGVSAVDGVLVSGDNHIDLNDMHGLRGRHNWQNACAAFAVGQALGLSVEKIETGMKSFKGLVHRMESVGHIGSVLFVNDSKGTNADATGHALATFDHIYWIAGGRSKQGGIEPLRPYFSKISKAYLIGEAAQDFADTLNGDVPFDVCDTLDNAVANAARDAALNTQNPAVVLLSPACASFDQFSSFEVRGDVFRALVSDLKGIELTKGVAA